MSRLLQSVFRRRWLSPFTPNRSTWNSNLHNSRGPHVRLTVARPFVWSAATLAVVSAVVAQHSIVHLDAQPPQREEQSETTDPATSIKFPNTLRIQSKSPLPDFELVGVGVRTVSFLGIKVYSVAFYADLRNPRLNIPKSATPNEKIDYIVRNTACVLRIVPSRSTSYSHLRDGFMRALQARMVLCKQRSLLTQEQELEAQSPLRKLKSMFPNTALAKHTPLDILLLPPEQNQPRTLVVRDLGALQNDWVAEEFFMAYFEAEGISPPLKTSVTATLETFGN